MWISESARNDSYSKQMACITLLFHGLSPPDFFDWMVHNRGRRGAAVVRAATSKQRGWTAGPGSFGRAVYMFSQGVSASVDGCLSLPVTPR